jgi:hypothetical protein
MDLQSIVAPTRRPRFRRASEPPAFRLTDDDVHIVRQLVRHRFLRSAHIAALVGRSLDRTNDRLLRLFHAAYIDRPRAQLDFYPVGSAPMVYALADRGAAPDDRARRHRVRQCRMEPQEPFRDGTGGLSRSARQQIARTGGLAQA